MDFPAWDPVLLSIPGLPIAIRWYGLMYVVGFVIGQQILVRLARSGFFPVDPKVAPDLVFYCVIGVMLGGRTGYALFYDQSLLWPWEFVKVWRGGLAFHGGLAGVAVAAWLFARRHGLRWAQVGDACALAVTPGIFAVRMANFINGELYGRITDRTTFGAMQFPTDPTALRLLGLSDGLGMRDRELGIQVAYGKRTFAEVRDQLSSVDAFGDPIPWDAIAPRLDWAKVSQLADPAGNPLVPFRHPSQLYEGVAEGPLLGLILLGLYVALRGRARRPGVFIVVFLVGYAVLRGMLENVRQPDAQFGPTGEVLLGMTMGQTLSSAMVVGAALVVLFTLRSGRNAPPRPR
jgi:phosphatidylglycerol:prolipoprotein diacylglycerol transferase